jgi:hypothetical protein
VLIVYRHFFERLTIGFALFQQQLANGPVTGLNRIRKVCHRLFLHAGEPYERFPQVLRIDRL